MSEKPKDDDQMPSEEEEGRMQVVEWPEAFDYQDPRTGVVIRFRNKDEFQGWRESQNN